MSQKREELEKTWAKTASTFLVDRTIKSVRYLNQKELDNLGWNTATIVLELDDGSLWFPSRDEEGNDAGALFGQGADGSELTFPVIR